MNPEGSSGHNGLCTDLESGLVSCKQSKMTSNITVAWKFDFQNTHFQISQFSTLAAHVYRSEPNSNHVTLLKTEKLSFLLGYAALRTFNSFFNSDNLTLAVGTVTLIQAMIFCVHRSECLQVAI